MIVLQSAVYFRAFNLPLDLTHYERECDKTADLYLAYAQLSSLYCLSLD